MIRAPVVGQNQTRYLAQAPFGTVARDGISDLLGAGKADAQCVCLALSTLSRLQQKSAARHTPSARRFQKVAAFLQGLKT